MPLVQASLRDAAIYSMLNHLPTATAAILVGKVTGPTGEEVARNVNSFLVYLTAVAFKKNVHFSFGREGGG